MTPQQIELALETIALVLEDLKKTQEKQQATITALEEALKEHAMQEVQRLGQEIEQGRTWVGLTDEEIDYFIVHRLTIATKNNLVALIRICEAKLKEKNT